MMRFVRCDAMRCDEMDGMELVYIDGREYILFYVCILLLSALFE